MRPILIVAPPYNRLDSNVKALHLLCHYLNEAGAEAYLTTEIMNPLLKTSYTWQTPARGGALYPEAISGHPYGTPKYARWILGVRRPFGDTWEENEKLFVYSARFNQAAETRSENIETLWVPTFDYRAFAPPAQDQRKGYVVYMKDMSRLPDWYEPTISTVIKKEKPISQSAMVDAFQSSELFITDDPSTSMIDEARCCGCPVWINADPMKFDDYSKIEYGVDGTTWEESGIAVAIRDVGKFRKQYLDYAKNLGNFLRRFMEVMG